MKKILLFPYNGNAREALTSITAINKQYLSWSVLGFIDDDLQKKGLKFGDYRVLGNREKISEYPDALVLAVPGRPDNFFKRVDVIHSLGLSENRFATIIHPSVQKGINCDIGRNVLLMANVVLTAQVKIGSHVVILPNTVVSHDSQIGDYTIIGSNVSISGGVKLEQNCYVGSGSKIIQEVEIGARAMVGLGSVVLKDVPRSSTVAGNPARIIKSR